MISEGLCERCNRLVKHFQNFPCGHTICYQCLSRNIAFNHSKQILTQDQLKISCQCKLGTIDLRVEDIPPMLNDSFPISTCPSHKASARLHCEECKIWLCEECIETHKMNYPLHQLEYGELGKCETHPKQIQDLYCHDCQSFICSVCTIETEHSTHNYQKKKDYADQLRTYVPKMDVSAQMMRIEKIREDFNNQLDAALTLNIKQMDELILKIEEFKKIYRCKMKHLSERADILFSLIKIIYSDFQAAQDISILKELSSWNIELTRIDLQDATEKKLITIGKDLTEYFDTSPLESIHATWIQIGCSIHAHKPVLNNSLTLSEHKYPVSALLQLEDGRIVAGTYDDIIAIYEVQANEFQATPNIIDGHNGPVYSLIQLSDGRIVSGSFDQTIKIWEEKDRNFSNTVTLTGHSGPVYSVIQLKDGRIASGSGDSTIIIWKVSEGDINTMTLSGHSWSVNSLIQLKDGRIVSGSGDNTIIVWTEREYSFVMSMILNGHNNAITALLQLKDGRIASGSKDKTIKIWEITEKDYQNTLSLMMPEWTTANSLIQLNDGRIASGSNDSTIQLWEVTVNDFKLGTTLTGHRDSVSSLILLKDGRLASGSNDKQIKIWE